MEVIIDNRTAELNIISKKDNTILVNIDGKEYHLDIVKVENGVYSVLFKGQSINIETVKEKDHRNYSVTLNNNFHQVEIIDAFSKYRKNRQANDAHEEGRSIFSPMPGKVVRILVNEGDPVEKGQKLIIVSAMKMESEYKAGISGIVSEVNVKEGDTVDSNQVMIKLSD